MVGDGGGDYGYLLEDGFGSHAPYWKADCCQVELTTENGSTDLGDDTLDRTAKVVHGLHVVQREAAVLVCVGATELVFHCQRLKFFGFVFQFVGVC